MFRRVVGLETHTVKSSIKAIFPRVLEILPAIRFAL
jgi:hypothetical protein